MLKEPISYQLSKACTTKRKLTWRHCGGQVTTSKQCGPGFNSCFQACRPVLFDRCQAKKFDLGFAAAAAAKAIDSFKLVSPCSIKKRHQSFRDF